MSETLAKKYNVQLSDFASSNPEDNFRAFRYAFKHFTHVDLAAAAHDTKEFTEITTNLTYELISLATWLMLKYERAYINWKKIMREREIDPRLARLKNRTGLLARLTTEELRDKFLITTHEMTFYIQDDRFYADAQRVLIFPQLRSRDNI